MEQFLPDDCLGYATELGVQYRVTGIDYVAEGISEPGLGAGTDKQFRQQRHGHMTRFGIAGGCSGANSPARGVRLQSNSNRDGDQTICQAAVGFTATPLPEIGCYLGDCPLL
ncbi:MAG: hypothetical protein GYA46_07440 [candidate division Zixibacteria bacterium]|nr:hypothetical protein [candidate division Zixibacteria bacterium]